MKLKFLYSLLPLAALSSLQAATTTGGVTLAPLPGLSANSTHAIWNTLSGYTTGNPNGVQNTGSFPGTMMWAPQNSQPGSTESVTKLTKISNSPGNSGGPYGASGSMYYGGFNANPNVFGGTLALTNNAPIANLETVIFQIQIGEAFTYDFYNDEAPLLTYTLGSDTTLHTLAAAAGSNFHRLNNGTVEMPTGTETIYINSYAMWFDFSAISGDVSSFSVSWTGVQHAQLYGVSLQQDSTALSSSILPAAVPEPSAVLLGCAGALFLIRRRR